MKRSFGLTAAALLAAGCAPGAETATADGVQGSATPIMAGLSWTSAVSGAGAGLTLAEADGTVLLRLACLRSPAALSVTVPRFRPIGSEDRLTLGLGENAYPFVADLAADPQAGVEARGPISADLLNGLAEASGVSAVYGSQRIGPHIPPDPDAARAFAAACRQAVAS